VSSGRIRSAGRWRIWGHVVHAFGGCSSTSPHCHGRLRSGSLADPCAGDIALIDTIDTIDTVEGGPAVLHDNLTPVGSLGDSGNDLWLPARSRLRFILVAASAMAVLCIRNHSVFSLPIREQGDEAANSILVNQAVHFQLLVGNYSREGFNHPGPAFLYIQSFGQELFYSWLHVVPAPFNGQLIALFMLNSAILALTVLVIARHTRSWSIAILALSAIVLLTGHTLSWTSAWFPYLYAAPFLLATLSGVSVAVGALQDLPIFTFAVALLVHGHVAFIGIMGIYVALVVVAWLVLHRGMGYGARLRNAKSSLLASGAIVFLFAIPIAAELILHWPGQFGHYWHYLRSNSHPNPLGQVISYVVGFWPGGHIGATLLVLAGLGTAILAITDPHRRRRRFVLGAFLSVVLLTVQTGLYAYRGVDYLSLNYTGYFYYSVPTVIVAILLVEGLGRIGAGLTRPGAHHTHRRAMATPFALTAGFGMVVFATQTSTMNTYWGEPSLPRVAAVIHNSPLRHDRGVAFSMAVVGKAPADWPDVVGLLVAASREGYQPCIADPSWQFLVTSQYICSQSGDRNRWMIAAQPPSVPVPSNAALVFRDASVEVFTAPPVGS